MFIMFRHPVVFGEVRDAHLFSFLCMWFFV